MRTNATIVSITRAGETEPYPRNTRCLFTGPNLVDQGGTAAVLKAALVIPHHELVRDIDIPPYGFPKIGDTIKIRLDTHEGTEFGDDVAYEIETARGVPGGPLKHWYYTLK